MAGKKGMVTAAEAEALFKEKMAKEKANGTKYKVETYMVVARWTEQTKLKYGPNPKTPGSKSHPRYQKYMKAKTVGDALRLGAYPPDLLWDYERGFYKVVGGPTRNEPIDLARAQAEGVPVTNTDKILGKWFLKELCKSLGVDHKKLVKESTWQESAIMRGLRLLTDKEAGLVLATVQKEKRDVTNTEMLQVLRKWSYFKNPWRVNVMKKGQTWVNSDSVGLCTGRDGDVHIHPATLRYPNVMKLIARYIHDRQPPELKTQFHFTSINMNFGYGAQRHRDGNNTGLSMLAAFGDCKGGDLRYFPDDDKSKKVDQLATKDSITVDLKKNLLLFDGQRCHEVTPFEGERYSMVWFTCARYWEAPTALKDLRKLGFEIPTDKSVAAVSSALRKPAGSSAKVPKQPGALMWPSERGACSTTGAKKRAASKGDGRAGKRAKTAGA